MTVDECFFGQLFELLSWWMSAFWHALNVLVSCSLSFQPGVLFLPRASTLSYLHLPPPSLPLLHLISCSDQYYRPFVFYCRLHIVVLCLKSPSSSLHLGNLLELSLTYGPDSPQLSSLPIIRTLSCQSLDGLINSSVPTCIKLPA